MYSETEYNFIPHATTQGLVFMVNILDGATATDEIANTVGKLISFLDSITVTDTISQTNENIIIFTSEVKGFSISSKITLKRHE